MIVRPAMIHFRPLSSKHVVRGKKVITTNPDAALRCPGDKLNLAVLAQMPDRLWGGPSKGHRFKRDGRRFHLCLKRAGGDLHRFRDQCLHVFALEAEEAFYENSNARGQAAQLVEQAISGNPRGVTPL